MMRMCSKHTDKQEPEMRSNRKTLTERWDRRRDEREDLPCHGKFTFATKALAQQYVDRSGKATCVYACQQLTCFGEWHVSNFTPEELAEWEQEQYERALAKQRIEENRRVRAEALAQDMLNDADRLTYRK